MASISLKQIQKSFGDVEVVKGLDLEIPNGQFTVLVGPSGCGKTTTLRMIAGLETVDSGVIQIGDNDVTKLEPKDRDVAMVFQNYALYPHMSVKENIEFVSNQVLSGMILPIQAAKMLLEKHHKPFITP